MNCKLAFIRPLTYGLILAGCVVALVTAFEPELTGAWHLSAGYLVCGLIPWIVYASVTSILDDCTLLAAGGIVLGADLVARLAFDITSAAQASLLPAVWLCALLVLAVLPPGILLGKLLTRVLT